MPLRPPSALHRIQFKVAACPAALAALLGALKPGKSGFACTALAELSAISGERSAAVAAAGGLPRLVVLLDRPETAGPAIMALLAIINGEKVITYRAEAAAGGVVSKMVDVLRTSTSAPILTHAILILGSMAFDTEGLRL